MNNKKLSIIVCKTYLRIIIISLAIVTNLIVLNLITDTQVISLNEYRSNPYANQYNFTDLISYNGPIEHLFFHPLVAYPELAFDGDYKSKGMDQFFTTPIEFRRILEEEMYNKGYVLVDPQIFYGYTKNAKGKIVYGRTNVMFPVGKKPLVISVDDINYYQYMKDHGCVYKLIVDNDGRVATYSKTPQGVEKIDYDNEVVPILDNFVKEHPDFSYQGAKGVLALTGYDGILGYRTDTDTGKRGKRISRANRNSEIEAAKVVIAKLKETGWIFASHSYGHPHMSKVSYGSVVSDTKLWDAEVKPLVGSTRIFIYPFGETVQRSASKLKYLKSKGFDIFCGVGTKPYQAYKYNTVLTMRRHCDGIAFRGQRKYFIDIFDVNNIIDWASRQNFMPRK